MRYKRALNLAKLLEKKSFFLFGPRSTGKTFLINEQLKGKALIINLLESGMYLRLAGMPSELEDIIMADMKGKGIVVIDEIQKIPGLLSEVHNLIEKTGCRFLLTGSSARKLRRGQADMLAGRAWTARLFPLCYSEIPDFDLDRYLRYGGLPSVYPSKEPEEDLDSYVETYLKEEIRAEGLVRNMPPFARFLKIAALSNGTLLNFAQISSDCAVPASTVREYYSMLEDTLVGFMLEPWVYSKKRKAIQTAKFYFFDTGVTHALAGTRALDRNSDLYGTSFEQFIGMELRAYLGYSRIKDGMAFWRSTNGHEVEFLVGDHTAVEAKSTRRVSQGDIRGLRALSEEGVFKKFFLVTHDRVSTKKDGIAAIHWKEFLEMLWKGEIV